MIEIVAIVEGQTEQTFVQQQLAGHLAAFGITIWPVLPGRQPRGGTPRWSRARDDMARVLKSGKLCTTMFDFYGMPESWPGRIAARSLPWAERAVHVEIEIARDVSLTIGQDFNPARFIPYVQLHEFEALAFADVDKLASITADLARTTPEALATKFAEIVTTAGSPEAINDGYRTCPSRRITAEAPGYSKRVHGVIVTQRIGLDHLRTACPHFGRWLKKLESLGQNAHTP